jgi:hypothetical protein
MIPKGSAEGSRGSSEERATTPGSNGEMIFPQDRMPEVCEKRPSTHRSRHHLDPARPPAPRNTRTCVVSRSLSRSTCEINPIVFPRDRRFSSALSATSKRLRIQRTEALINEERVNRMMSARQFAQTERQRQAREETLTAGQALHRPVHVRLIQIDNAQVQFIARRCHEAIALRQHLQMLVRQADELSQRE